MLYESFDKGQSTHSNLFSRFSRIRKITKYKQEIFPAFKISLKSP